MKRLAIWLFISVTVASLSYGDGGTFSFSDVPESLEDVPWYPEYNTLFSDRQAMFRLPDGSMEEGFSFPSAGGLYFAISNPCRLYRIDPNGESESAEIVAESVANPKPESKYPPVFQNFPLSIEIDSQSIPIRADAEYAVYRRGSREYVNLTVYRIHTRLLGEIEIDGKTYQACMIFRSPNSHPSQCNGIVVLNTNGDMVFDPYEDAWFSSQGIAWFDGKAWVVTREVTEKEIDIHIQPYERPAGEVEFVGEHIDRVYLQSTWGGQSHLICLPVRENRTFALPESSYRLHNAWLRVPGVRETFFQYYNRSYNINDRNMGVYAASGQKAQFDLAGPQRAKLKVNPKWFGQRLFLRYDGHPVGRGYTFVPIEYHDIGRCQVPSAPRWEIKDSQGNLLAEGKFEYG